MKTKRILSLVLCILMVLSTMSFSVFAENTETSSVAAMINESKYETLADAIAAVGTDATTITVLDGTHTLSGSVANKNITIKGKNNAVIVASAGVGAAGSTINFEGVTVDFGVSSYIGFQHSEKITYTDCTHIGTEFLYAPEVSYTNCIFNIEGDAYAVWTYAAEDVDFTNCTFNTDGKAVLVYIEREQKADINVSGCTFNATTDRGKAAIELGESAYGNTAEYTVEITNCSADSNFVANNTESNLLGNKNNMNLDLVEGENGFTATAVTYDIDDFKAALAGSKDAEGNYVFDGEGKTYKWTIGNTVNQGDKNAPDRFNSNNAQYYLLNGETGSVTMKNVNFVFTAPNGIVSGNIIGSGNTVGAAQLYFENTGDFTVENCKFEKTVLTNFYGAGNSSVTDCTFTNIDNSYAVKDIRGAKITVSGNTFENCSGGIMVSAVNDDSEVNSVIVKDNEFTNVSADGKDRGLVQLAKAGVYADDAVSYENNTATNCGSTFRLLNESAWTDVVALVDNSNGALTLTADSTVDRVAMIGTNVYKSLDDAIKAAKDDDVIKLLTDIEIKTINQEGLVPIANHSITIDGKNTYKVTATGDGVSTVGVSNGTLTLQNLTLVDESVSYAESAWEFAYLEIGGNLVFDNVIVADPVMFDNAKATVKNSTFTGKTVDGLNMYGAWVQGGNVTFTNCTFDGTRGIKACDEYNSTVEALTVDSCTFNNLTQKPGIALDIDTGDVKVANNTFNKTEVFETTTAIDITFANNTVDGVAYAPYVAEVDGVKYYSLAYALDAVLTSEKADMTLTLLADVDLTGWTSVNYGKNHSTFVFDGNGYTITGLTAPLFSKVDTYYEASVTIKNLTFSNINIETSDKAAAVVGWYEAHNSADVLVIENVHVTGGTIESTDSYAAGLVGYTSIQDGSSVTITNCSVKNTKITGANSTGSIVGHAQGIAIDECVVGNNTINTTDSNIAKVGVVAGTVNGATQQIDVTEESASTSNYTLNVIGRAYNTTEITGGKYFTDPTFASFYGTDNDGNITAKIIPGKLLAIEYVAESGKYETVAVGTLQNSAYTSDKDGIVTIWGELRANPETELRIDILTSDGTVMGSVKLNDVDGIYASDTDYLTWHMMVAGEEYDTYWSTSWNNGYPTAKEQPAEAKLYIDGKPVDTVAIQMNASDGISPVVWKDLFVCAKIGTTEYKSIQAAIDAANSGDTITLVTDRTEADITVVSDDNITIDLGGNTLTGNIVNKGILTVKNGTIENNDFVSCIESTGDDAKLTLEAVNATSTRHALRIEGGEATIESGTYRTLGKKDGVATTHALNAGGDYVTKVTVNGGTFIGVDSSPYTDRSDSGAAVNAYANATVIINGGEFMDGQNITIQTKEDDDVIIKGGTFDQDPSAYVAEGLEATAMGGTYTVNAKRKFVVETDRTQAKADDIVTVTVRAVGKELVGATWALTFEADKFEYTDITFDSDYNGEVIDSSVAGKISAEVVSDEDKEEIILATLKFKTKAISVDSLDKIGTFAVTEDSIVWNVDESATLNSKIGKADFSEASEDVEIIHTSKITEIIKVNGETVSTDSVSYDYNPEKSYTVTVEGLSNSEITYVVNNENKTASDLVYSEFGKYEITYTIKTDGYATTVGTFTVEIKKPAYVVEINLNDSDVDFSNFINGKRIVIVHTDTPNINFKYDGLTMIDVSSKSYTYVDHNNMGYSNREYIYEYAIVVDDIENGTFADYEGKITWAKGALTKENILTIDEANTVDKYDLNFVDSLTPQDVTFGYGVRRGEATYYAKYMKSVLKTDVDCNKVVDGSDTGAVYEVYKNQ